MEPLSVKPSKEWKSLSILNTHVNSVERFVVNKEIKYLKLIKKTCVLAIKTWFVCLNNAVKNWFVCLKMPKTWFEHITCYDC